MVYVVLTQIFNLMKSLLLSLCSVFAATASFAQLPAFKGAEGFGALASGGRGKEVYHVANLNDAGAGSFREAVSRPGRNIVFDVGGVIYLKSRIDVAGDITIAGQTAPAPGITFYGASLAFNKIENVIVRYVRMHGSINMSKGTCVLIADSSRNLIFDHVSVAWGRWDDVHIKGSSNITLQYCIIGESLDPQRFGALLERPENLSIHHCLWIDNQSRNPKAKARIEYINNVIYNWGTSGFVGGHSSAHHYQDVINNYFISGPSSSPNYLSMFTKTDHVFQSGNYVDTNKDGGLDGRLIQADDFDNAVLHADIVKEKQNTSSVPVTIDATAIIVAKVLKEAGASLYRDKVDVRLTQQLQSLGKDGAIIWTETQVGGQEKVAVVNTTVIDSDKDGISDDWEHTRHLDPDKADAATLMSDGYSYLEHYWEDLIRE